MSTRYVVVFRLRGSNVPLNNRHGGSQQEAGFKVHQSAGGVHSDPVRLLELLLHVDAVRRASGLQEEAGHPHPVPVRGHGGGRALRQLHVVRGEEEVVRDGGRRSAGGQHVRVVRRRAGALRRLAQGTNVFQSAGYRRRLPGSGQRGRGGVQAEISQQIPAVHWTGFPGNLPHLHGVLPAEQQRGPAGLPGPHPGWRDHPHAAGGAVRRVGSGLPLGLLRPPGRSDPGHRPAPGGPVHRRQPGLLAPQPQGGVLEPDEADWTQRGHLRHCAHPSHRRLKPLDLSTDDLFKELVAFACAGTRSPLHDFVLTSCRGSLTSQDSNSTS